MYKNQVCLFKWVYIINYNEKRLKLKNRSHSYDINRPRPRHRHKYTKYKMRLSIITVICIKQHLSNMRSSFHERVKQHWGWVGYKKSV